jgi:hypothetical protein
MISARLGRIRTQHPLNKDYAYSFYESRWDFWKKSHEHKNIESLTKKTSDLVKQYLFDMERGENVSTRNKRGGMSASRLNKIAYTLTWVLIKLRENYNLLDITKATSSQFADLFRNMRDGKLLTICLACFK